jgi:hypothetical protein
VTEGGEEGVNCEDEEEGGEGASLLDPSVGMDCNSCWSRDHGDVSNHCQEAFDDVDEVVGELDFRHDGVNPSVWD